VVKRQRFLRLAVVASVIALCFAISCSRERFFDFRAFYCAGQVERSGADPYRVHPLYECEQSVGAPAPSPFARGVTVPAPFPGFVLMIFAALASLPFPVALLIWEGLAIISVGFAAVLVARTTNTGLVANAIVLGFPAAAVGLPLGQVTPFALLAVTGCAALLQYNRPRWGALAALGAFFDPHVGLGLVLGIFAGVPRARSVLFAGGAALSLLSIATSGALREWEYLHFVIPAHARANVADAGQFSTTHFAFIAGARPALALSLGSLWYVGALVVGIIVASRLRERLGIAAIAYIPTAFAVFGGMHTHLAQLALAVPAFMLLTSSVTGRRREWCGAGTFFAAIPWLSLALGPLLCVAPPALAIVFAEEMNGARHRIHLFAASCVTICAVLLAYSQQHVARTVLLHDIPGNPLAEASWQMYTLARNVPPEPWYLVAKAPTVIAFMLLFVVLVKAALLPPVLVEKC
jgi:hypothetical protein